MVEVTDIICQNSGRQEIEKKILDNKQNKPKIYNWSLDNNKNTINLLGQLEISLVPMTGRHIDAEMFYQVVNVWNQYCCEVFTFFNSNGPIWDPEWCDGFFGPYFFYFPTIRNCNMNKGSL